MNSTIGSRARRAAAFVIAFTATVCATAFVPAGASAANCGPKMTPAEVSMEVRKLQTTLMVAALSCGHRANYNKFVTRFKPSLQKHGDVMRAHFVRRYGGKAKFRLNKYVTALANEASQRSNDDFKGFCREAGTLFHSLETRAPHELGPFVTKPKDVEFGVAYKPKDGECNHPKPLFPDVRKVDPLER